MTLFAPRIESNATDAAFNLHYKSSLAGLEQPFSVFLRNTVHVNGFDAST